MKSAFVSIVGRPSSGKSTFLNNLCGKKISIVSTVAQTTRNKIRGIYNSGNGQLIFIDTPGFHLSQKKFNLFLKDTILSSLQEVDLVLYMVDISRIPGEEERKLMSVLTCITVPVVVALNKTDLSNTYEAVCTREIQSEMGNVHIFKISALKGSGIDSVAKELMNLAPEGDKLYPDDFYTDQLPEFRITEIIREKAINATRKEVPHSIYVDVEDLEKKENPERLWVRGFIYVERESQKGILVGKRGEKIRAILSDAEKDLKEIFPYAVEIDFRVKVKPKWKKNDRLLRRILK